MPRLALLAAVAATFASAAHAAPVVLLNDTFDSTGATRGDDANDPADVAFHGFTGALDVVGGRLRGATSGADARFASSAFAPATLAGVGDRVTLRFALQGVSDGASTLNFKIGLYDSRGTLATDDAAASRDAAADDRGVMFHLWDSPGNAYSSLVQADVSGRTLEGEFGAYVGARRFADGSPHTYELTLVRTATGLNAAFSYDGVLQSTAQLSTGATLTRFDNVQFGTGTQPFDFFLDDVAVTYAAVPEPGTLAVMGAVALVRRRRR